MKRLFLIVGIAASAAIGQHLTGDTQNAPPQAPVVSSDFNPVDPGIAGLDTCGIKKSPDQGAFWQPLSPEGSHVYANSFVPCESGEVSNLGTWMLDLGGLGGPGVRFEVWGSIGNNPANGPDASNVIAGTGSLSLPGTPTLEFYDAPATFSGSLNAGDTYWFVATCVGEPGGVGAWQVGAHTQNSEIADNGTFWFSNDPAGVNFDGQNVTPEFAFCLEMGPPQLPDCGLKKSPDQGAFWQPLSPEGSYVYANSFVPCDDGQVDELGTWLLDLGGLGGPGVRFEVWGSIGGDPANGPDASNVIASTGSLSLPGTGTLDFYSAPATTTGDLDAGTTYWFVATCVGEAGGVGSWQMGAHTQNSEVMDNGTFWFSNDPAGVNFDGQNVTPEIAFCVETSPNLGDAAAYYTDFNQASTDPAAGLAANGLNPIQLATLTGADLSPYQVLVINESANGFPSNDVINALPAIQAWVEAGGKLIVHDRYVSGGGLENNPFFIGAPGMLALRDFGNDADVDVQTGGTEVTNGSFGVIDDTSLDGGTSSTHGYVDASTLPTNNGLGILERGGAPNEIVSLSYLLGDGAVFYSTIPLDFYLAGNGPNPPLDNMNNIYYPNVIEYMLNLGGGCAADCDGNGVLNILDFVCFQTEWQNQTALGDCDGNGVYNILDFVCYQGAFQAGCP